MSMIKIGFTKKTHGLKGELKAQVEPHFLEDFLKAKTVFLEIRGKHVPYFVENIRPGNDLIVKFEEVDKPEQAQAIGSKEIFLREKDILLDEEREIPIDDSGYGFCKGFALIDQTAGEIGKILTINELPQGEMAVLEYKGREILIPLIPQFVHKVDKRDKKVFVNLPDGLLSL